MTDIDKDSDRAVNAVSAIIDGRNFGTSMEEIMDTAERTIATLLIAIFKDPQLAAIMLNEAMLIGIERKIANYGSGRAGA